MTPRETLPDVGYTQDADDRAAMTTRAAAELDEAIVERIAGEIAGDIIRDLNDRKGLRHAWDGIDPEIAAEIHDTWAGIALTRMRAALPRVQPAVDGGAVGSPASIKEPERLATPDGRLQAEAPAAVNVGHLTAARKSVDDVLTYCLRAFGAVPHQHRINVVKEALAANGWAITAALAAHPAPAADGYVLVPKVWPRPMQDAYNRELANATHPWFSQSAWEAAVAVAPVSQPAPAAGGYVLVPKEPTKEMLKEANEVHYYGRPMWVYLADAGLNIHILDRIYRAMLAAAPVSHPAPAADAEVEAVADMHREIVALTGWATMAEIEPKEVAFEAALRRLAARTPADDSAAVAAERDLLTRAADMLNTHPKMKAMDLGYEITQYLRARSAAPREPAAPQDGRNEK